MDADGRTTRPLSLDGLLRRLGQAFPLVTRGVLRVVLRANYRVASYRLFYRITKNIKINGKSRQEKIIRRLEDAADADLYVHYV